MQLLLVPFFMKIGDRRFSTSCSIFLCSCRHVLLGILYFMFSTSRLFNLCLKAMIWRNENKQRSFLNGLPFSHNKKSCMSQTVPQTGDSALALLGTGCNSSTQSKELSWGCTCFHTTTHGVSIFHSGVTC